MYRIWIVTLALAVLLLPGQVSAATFLGQNGRIAFTKSNGEVWSVSANGDHARRLTPHRAQDMAWSPDGTRLAFTELRQNGNARLQVFNVRTGKVQSLTHQASGSESTPVWSYDGSQIAFVRAKNEHSAVFTVKANGQNEKNVTGWSANVSYRAPSWSPDNTRMVYEEFSDSAARLVITDFTHSNVRELVQLSDVTESSGAAWSPNGKKILFNDSEGQVYTIWADGTHRAVISDGDSYDAAWSPDGNRIAFLEDFSGEYVSVSGSDGSISYVSLTLAGYDSIRSPIWSPDGTKVLFAAARTGESKKDLFSATVTDAPIVAKLARGSLSAAAWQSKP